MIDTVELDIEFETPSGHIWEFIARGTICPAEPDVGVFGRYVNEFRLFWSSGKEFSSTAYRLVSKYPCLNDHIVEELLEC